MDVARLCSGPLCRKEWYWVKGTLDVPGSPAMVNRVLCGSRLACKPSLPALEGRLPLLGKCSCVWLRVSHTGYSPLVCVGACVLALTPVAGAERDCAATLFNLSCLRLHALLSSAVC